MKKVIIGLVLLTATLVVAWFGYNKITAIQERNSINELKRMLTDTYILDIQYPYTNGKEDAVVVYTTNGVPGGFYTRSQVGYYEKVKGRWTKRTEVQFSAEELGMIEYWSDSQGNPRLYHGYFENDGTDNDVRTMWVDGKRANEVYHEESNLVFWYAFANEYAQVVREDNRGDFRRVESWYDTGDGYMGEVVTSIHDAKYNKTMGKEYVYAYTGDAMRYVENEYNAYPLIIIPTRNVTGFQTTDVLLIEKDNGEYDLARLIADEGMVEIQNGKIIRSTGNWDTDSMYYAKFGGYHSKIEYEEKEKKEAPDLFTLTMPEVTLGEDEYFVAPDNWGSDSVFGVIKKGQVIGKVKGYYDPLSH